MDTSFLFQNCYTGTDFENLMVQFLGEHGFRAKKTGSNDGGIDIIATSITRPIKYSFNIQCKFFNKPLSKAPIQEVYASSSQNIRRKSRVSKEKWPLGQIKK